MARTHRAGPLGLSPGVSAAAPWKPAWGEKITSTDLVLAGAALALFLISEIVLFQFHTLPATRSETDGIGYMLRASGPVFQLADFHGPGYSFAIRAVALLGPDLFTAARIVSIAAGVAFLALSWLIVATSSGPREASVAIVLLAASPTVFLGAASILSDMLAAACFLGSFTLLSAPARISWRHFAAAGALAGLAYLTRSIYAAAFVIPIAIILLKLNGDPFVHNLRRLAAYFATFALITAPWLIFVYTERGSPFWSLNHLNLAFRMYREDQGWNAFPASAAFGGAWDVIRSDPARFLSLWFHQIAGAPARILRLVPPLAIAAAAGCLPWFFRMNRAKLAYLSAVTPYLLAVSLVWYEDRYYLIFAPLAAAFVATLIMALPKLASRVKLPAFASKSTASAAALAAVGLCIPQTVRTAEQFLADQAPEYQAAANWLREHGGPAVSVMAAKPHIAFYSSARDIRFRDVRLQDATPAEIPGILERARPAYFVYDERYSAQEFPNLRPFLDETSAPLRELLTPVFVAESPRKIVVYRVTGVLAAKPRSPK